MGILDFAKKQEFERIKHLESELSDKKKVIDKREAEIKLLNSNIEVLISQNSQLLEELKPFIPIQDIELQLTGKKNEINEIITKLGILENEYHENYSIFQKLKDQIKLFNEDIEIINSGLYQPIFNFNTTDEYRERIQLNYEKQKLLIRENKAITSGADEVYYLHKYKFLTAFYKKSIINYKRIILTAFNSECDALIVKAKWNNIDIIKDKIQNIFFRINLQSIEFCGFLMIQNNIVNNHDNIVNNQAYNFEESKIVQKNHMIKISQDFLELKYEELALYHEFEMKKYEEKEELLRNRVLLREEEKARREFERAKTEADEEEVLIKKQLQVAKIQASENSNNEALKKRIAELEEKLKAVREIRERAISMAQQTRRGYIYIISNIGSFGENIYKIGMTRRLDPFERVRELGNASVPFRFDVHTMIYSEDAPDLEKELHKTFTDRRINQYNHRREFFKVTLDDIQNKIQELNLSAEFISIPEAMEFRETQSILDRLLKQKLNETIIKSDEEINFPSVLQHKLS